MASKVSENRSRNQYPTVSIFRQIQIEELGHLILDFLDDFTNIGRLMFKSKTLFRLITNYFTYRIKKFNPTLFLSIPRKYQLVIAAKYLIRFERYFPALKGHCLIGSNDICGLILTINSIHNPFYLSRGLVQLIVAAFPEFSRHFANHSLPYQSETTWKRQILSICIQERAYYSIEAICRYDPLLIASALQAVSTRVMASQKRRFSIYKLEMLFKRLIQISSDEAVKKENIRIILLNAIEFSNMQILELMLPFWDGSIEDLDTESSEHPLVRVSRAGDSCLKLLERSELNSQTIVLALKVCKNVGNWEMATEIICRFPPEMFMNEFDSETIRAIRKILNLSLPIHVNDQIVFQQLDIDLNRIPGLPLLLASFGFRQQHVLESFRVLITNRVTEDLLKELSVVKSNKSYYGIASSLGHDAFLFNLCIVS
jgi:hypothetical protein